VINKTKFKSFPKSGGCFIFELDNINLEEYNEILSTSLDDIPNNTHIFFDCSEITFNYLGSYFSLLNIRKINKSIEFEIGSEGSDLKDFNFKDFIIYELMISELKKCFLNPTIKFVNNDRIENSSLILTYSFPQNSNLVKDILQNEIGPALIQIQQVVKLLLTDFQWNPQYEKVEKLFSLELLQPLFYKMGFEKVIYNHGTKEFGKDFILTTFNKFGVEDYYGVQVKAGNIRGNVKSEVDEIINQCDDAFKIPYKNIKRDQFFITKIIIAISGTFSENAKIKIQEKLSPVMKANIIFLDRDLISSLVRKYLSK
jgi:hypothetical protein